MGIWVSVPVSSNRQSSIPSATPEATAKFVPVSVTVAPSGNWLPGNVLVTSAVAVVIARPPSAAYRAAG